MKKTCAPKQILPPAKLKRPPLVFIKASRSPHHSKPFSIDDIVANTCRGIATSFIPDTNVLAGIERATNPRYPATDATLAHFGLLEYVTILRQCIRQNLAFSVSPIYAISEMPVEKSRLALQRYYAFGQRFGVAWQDDPQASTYPTLGRVDAPSIWSMTDEQRAFMGVNYACNLLMLAVRKTGNGRTPLQNFDQFMYEMISQVQLFSVRDAAIALYMYADPNAYEPTLQKVCRKIRTNFGVRDKKLPETFQDMEACALNSAYDMLLANFANLADTYRIDGVKQDNWVVTGDRKLATYMDICHNFNLGGMGPGVTTVLKPQESPDGYMQEGMQRIQWLGKVRQQTQPSLPTVDVMNDTLHRVTERVQTMLADWGASPIAQPS